MKKSLLLLFVCLFGALSGVKAYTVDDLTTAGWTKVSAISNDAGSGDYVGNFVYVLVDAGSSNYVMSGETTTVSGYVGIKPTYRTLATPCVTPYFVWTLEVRNGGFAMRNIVSAQYFNSNSSTDGTTKGLGWEDTMSDDYPAGTFTFTINSGKYDIQGVSSEKLVGPWNNGGSVASNGEAIAANKVSTEAPGFFIYRMAKATYLQKYLQQVPNLTAPVDVTFLIVNPNIYQGGAATDLPTGWVKFGEPEVDSDGYFTEGTGDSRLYAKRTNGNAISPKKLFFDYYQTISNLPGGKYKSKANTFNPGYGDAYLYIYSTTDFATKMSGTNSWSSGKDETPSVDISSKSSFNVGIKANFNFYGGAFGSDHTSIARADDFELQVDPYISSMAVANLSETEGAMTEGFWYHFKVVNTGKHILTATNLSNIIYTTGETTALSAAGSATFTATQELTSGTDYYVRSSSDNTLTITPCISAVATALPANGAMTAGEWYYFDVATAGHYDVVASSIANIVYTTNGDLAEDASVASKFSVKNNELSATRYYVKSSSAQTLQWFLTDDQDYSSRMSDELNDWTGVGAQTPKQKYGEGVETYNGNDNAFVAGVDVLYQTINNLPNGNYEVKFYAWENFANHQESGIRYGDNIAQVFANDATKDIYVTKSTTSAGFVEENSHTLNCHVTNGTLTYGVKNIATGGNWAVCRHISLTYTGPYNEIVENTETKTQTYEGTFTDAVDLTPTVECPIVDITGATFTGDITAHFGGNPNGIIYATSAQKIDIDAKAGGPVKNVISSAYDVCERLVITDGYSFVAPFDFEATHATYSRTVGASTNFGTICVPFALTSNEDIQYYTTDQITGGVLKLTEVASVDAGTPAIFKKQDSEATNITASTTATAVKKDAGEQGSSVVLKGTFERITIGTDGEEGTKAANGKYYINSSNQFCEGKDWFYVGAFRAYLEADGNNPARLSISVDDEATAINELKTLDEKQGLQDGKYLIDGKIIVVKAGKQYNVNGVIK